MRDKREEGRGRSTPAFPLFIDLRPVAPLRCRHLWQAPRREAGVASN